MFPITDQNIVIRKAEEKDTDLIYSFVNSDDVRSQSFNNEKIEYSGHVKWFNEKITADDFLILIAEEIDTGEFIGQVKYNLLKDSLLLVGIFINNKFSGKGFGTKLLQLTSEKALKYFNAGEIVAQIKKENIPSIKAFAKANYLIERETIINGSNAIEMIYRKR